MGGLLSLAKAYDSAGDSVRRLLRSGVGSDTALQRLYTEAASPHASPRADQYRRIANKIDEKYGSGDFETAARWDERLERWQDNAENAVSGLEDGVYLDHYRNPIEDSGTGVSLQLAEAYPDVMATSYLSRDEAISRLKSIAEDAMQRNVADAAGEDVFDFAKRVFDERQALRQRYRTSQTSSSIDDLLRRLQQ